MALSQNARQVDEGQEPLKKRAGVAMVKLGLVRRFSLAQLGSLGVLILLMAGGLAAAMGPQQRGSLDGPPPASDLRLFIDPLRSLGLKDILESDEEGAFVPVGGNSINLGFIRDAAWLRLSIPSDSDRTIFLSLTPNFVDLIDVYVGQERPVMDDEHFVHLHMGDHRPMVDDAFSGLSNIVPLELVAGETTRVYIRVAAVNSTLTLTAALYSPTHHTLRTTIYGLGFGAWFGGMIILMVIQLVFFHFDRKPYYPLLALATFTAMLVYTGTLGLSRLFLFPEGGIGNDIYTAATSWLGLATSALATASILEVRKNAPWVNRILLMGVVVGLVGVAFAFAGANLVFADFGNAAIIILSTLAAAQGVRSISKEGTGTRLRASAFVILWVGLIATIAQRAGLGSLPNWIAHSYAVACVVQTILLTASLGVRLRAAEAMNQAMREEALIAAQEAEQRANRLVEERTRELATAKQVAEDALRAELASQEQQIRFMEVISHQYRTPLAAIRTHVDNISLSLPREDEANQRRVDRVKRGIVRLVEVLEVNLARSRLQGPSFKTELVRTSLAELVVNAGARARDLLQSGIEVDVAPAAANTRIMADAEMLCIAIINLLENGVKFSAPKGKLSVQLSCNVRGDRAIIEVKDKGVGIPAEEIDVVRRHSVRGSNVGVVEGSGAGLSLVSRIAAEHNGMFELESKMGEGTIARLILPVA